jgi:hypothetical protein
MEKFNFFKNNYEKINKMYEDSNKKYIKVNLQFYFNFQIFIEI